MSHLVQLPRTCTILNTVRWDGENDHTGLPHEPEHPWVVNVVLNDPDERIAHHLANNDTGAVQATLALSFNLGGWMAWDHWSPGVKSPICPFQRIGKLENGGLVIFPAIVFLDADGKPVEWWKGQTYYQFRGVFPGSGENPWSRGQYSLRTGQTDAEGILTWEDDWTGPIEPSDPPPGEPETGLVLCLSIEAQADSATYHPIIIGELMIDP